MPHISINSLLLSGTLGVTTVKGGRDVASQLSRWHMVDSAVEFDSESTVAGSIAVLLCSPKVLG